MPSPRLDKINVVNVVIAQHFNLVGKDVQAQVLQVMDPQFARCRWGCADDSCS